MDKWNNYTCVKGGGVKSHIYLYSVHFPSMFKLDSECVYVWLNVLHWQFFVSGGACQCCRCRKLILGRDIG